MKKSILILSAIILTFSCSTTDESTTPEPETTGQTPPEENETGSGGEEELSINETFELTGLPLQIFELNIPNLPGNEIDYQIYIENDSTSIYDLMASKFEFVIPLDTELGEKSLSLKYKDKHYDLGNINIVEIVDVIPTNIGFYETGISSSPLVILDSLNNKIIPFMEDSKVQGISLESPDGKKAYFKLNEYYLPTHIQTDSINILFDDYNFENGTVDIAYYINNNFENAQIVTGVTISEDILELTSSIESRSFTKTNDEISKALSAVGVGISGSLCIISGVTALTGVFTWLGTIGAVSTCAGFVHGLLATINPQLENQLETYIDATLRVKLIKIGCITILNKPSPLDLFTKWAECTESILEGAAGIIKIFEEAEVENQENINELYNRLNSNLNIEPNNLDFTNTNFIPFNLYTHSFRIINQGSSSIRITSVSSPTDFSVSLPSDGITINQNSSRNINFHFQPTRIGAYNGSIILFTSQGKALTLGLDNIIVTGWNENVFYGNNQINAPGHGGFILGFGEDGSVVYYCTTGGTSNQRCNQNGSWSFDGFNLTFNISVTLTSTTNGEDSSRSFAYSYTGKLASRSFCIGTLSFTDSEGSTLSFSDSRVTFD